MIATMIMNGKKKTFEEVFKSPFEKPTKALAETVLEEIRKVHSAEYGWVEIDAYVEQLSNGNWRAVRHHAQYR